MVNRMVGVLQLRTGVYEEVEHDINATVQAFVVVVLVALSSVIGFALSGAFGGHGIGIGKAIGIIVAEIAGWLIWSYLTYLIGTRFFHGVASYRELLRTVGYADAPGILTIFRFLPFFGGILLVLSVVWRVVAGILAVRQALNVDTTKAIVTMVISFIPYALLMTLLTRI
ncbi:MAG: hypothetical protein EXR62_11940 [Chloroflexi bacterium]|nr:hypothetical protein [Chloroflexota bacterium]